MWEKILLALTLTFSLSLIARVRFLSNRQEIGEVNNYSEPTLVLIQSKK
jgi:hypothetical protein